MDCDRNFRMIREIHANCDLWGFGKSPIFCWKDFWSFVELKMILNSKPGFLVSLSPWRNMKIQKLEARIFRARAREPLSNQELGHELKSRDENWNARAWAARRSRPLRLRGLVKSRLTERARARAQHEIFRARALEPYYQIFTCRAQTWAPSRKLKIHSTIQQPRAQTSPTLVLKIISRNWTEKMSLIEKNF